MAFTFLFNYLTVFLIILLYQVYYFIELIYCYFSLGIRTNNHFCLIYCTRKLSFYALMMPVVMVCFYTNRLLFSIMETLFVSN